MDFINNKNDGNNEPYEVVNSSNKRHKGISAKSGENEADKVCNIYDLEGNYYEYVAEQNSYDSIKTYVRRGGSYQAEYQASNRGGNNGVPVNDHSFRMVLYIISE